MFKFVIALYQNTTKPKKSADNILNVICQVCYRHKHN